MHPPPCPPWGNRRDLPASRSMYGSQTFSSNSFNFKELSMRKSSSDYFTLKPARGCSPTSSLAADLSSNFHIDQSPQFPTPRRSLFSASFMLPCDTDDLITPPVDFEGTTTPPIPSSSPCNDLMMDISPLPHKQACFANNVAINVTLPSPSPEPTPEEDDEDDSFSYSVSRPSLASRSGAESLSVPLERRFARRPGLVRHKGYSTTSVPQKASSSDSQLPTFRFGGPSASTTSLDECFESPIADRKPVPMNLPVGPPSRRTSLACRNVGSPLNSHVKKIAPVRLPPRKQVRRSLSMFQHPDDVMKDHSEEYQPATSNSPLAMDVNEEYKHMLPHFIPDDEPDSLPRIQQDTLLNILNGNYNTYYDQIYIVDCRFEYEYNGGHIDGALNFNDKEALAGKLFEAEPSSKTLLVFHCEYSELRAPRMAKFVRNRDRAVNDFQYPKLTYPEMYILDGGYSKFFANHRTKCFPQNYVEMQDKNHEQECEKGLGMLKQNRAKLSRAQTFAFGQQSCHMEDSPTASGRMQTILDSPDYNNSPLGQTHFRRQLSY
ncbi:hypothetical protein AAFC00_001655 [Neodothiora populina]